MKLNWKLMMLTFVAVTAVAEDIDAEIIKNLEFFDKLTVVEDMDLVELQAQAEENEGADNDSAPEQDGAGDEQ